MLGPREVPWDCTFKNRNERITANQRQNKEQKKEIRDGMGWDATNEIDVEWDLLCIFHVLCHPE